MNQEEYNAYIRSKQPLTLEEVNREREEHSEFWRANINDGPRGYGTLDAFRDNNWPSEAYRKATEERNKR